MKHVKGAIEDIRFIVKKLGPHITGTKVKSKVTTPLTGEVTDFKAQARCEKASRAAQHPFAKLKKAVADKVRKAMGLKVNDNTVSENFEDFGISEACFDDICERVETILRKV